MRTLCSHCLLTDLLQGSAWGCWNVCCRTSPALVFFASCSFDLVSGFLAEGREGSEVSPWAIFQVTQGHCLGDFPPTHQVTVHPLYSLSRKVRLIHLQVDGHLAELASPVTTGWSPLLCLPGLCSQHLWPIISDPDHWLLWG